MNRHLRILLTPYFSNLDILFSQHLHENISLKRKGMKIRIIKDFDIPYKECALYYKPLLNTNQIFFQKSPIRKTCLTFKKWDKNIQTVGFNGAGTVYVTCLSLLIWNINRFSHKWPKIGWLHDHTRPSKTTAPQNFNISINNQQGEMGGGTALPSDFQTFLRLCHVIPSPQNLILFCSYAHGDQKRTM